MGRAMAGRLGTAGWSVCGYDLAAAACDAAAGLGVEVLPDARAVAAETKTIVLSLMTSEDRRRLCWGDQDLAAALSPGTVLLDTTTARPEDILEDHARLAASGVQLVDVCLSGSSQVAAEGRSLALIGAPEADAAYRDLL